MTETTDNKETKEMKQKRPFWNKAACAVAVFVDNIHWFNALTCFVAMSLGCVNDGGRWFAMIGWCVAACAWLRVGQEHVWTNRFRRAADRSMMILEAALGGKVVGVYEVHKDAPEEPEAKKAEVANEADNKGIPKKTEQLVKQMADCTIEAFKYLKNGNYDFTVRTGGVELVVHDYEMAAEPAPEHAPEASKDGQDAPKA